MCQLLLRLHQLTKLYSASLQATPAERFLGMLKYSISSWSLTKFPYKPIISLLGETAQYSSPYHGSADPADRVRVVDVVAWACFLLFIQTYAFAENLRKDPPYSCLYITNPKYGVTYEGTIELQPKFKQAHVQGV
jgi:hypothetical protein